MSKRSYSDREKAEALAVFDSCGNVSETERITGIPDSTLHQWIKNQTGVNDDLPDMREFKKLELAEKLDRIAHQCAGLLPGKLPDSKVREIVGAMSQSIEKAQLLRGAPTVITSNADLTGDLTEKYGLTEIQAKSIVADVYGEELASNEVQ